MELAQAEALGALNHHHGGVGHVHADFDHRRGHQYVGAARHEGGHVEILLLAALLPVDDGHLVVRQREGADDLLVALLEVLQVHLLALEDEREDHEDLAAAGDFLPHELVHRRPAVLPDAHRLDGLAPRRHLVDDRHVEVAVERHRQRARYRRGSHDQNVRRHILV